VASTETQKPAIPQLPKHKVKLKKPGQRACNEKDAKGKICAGHLKRWYYLADVLEQQCGDVEKTLGRNAEIYRCENCKTLYLPNPADPTGLNVAGEGEMSVFGLTIPPKDDKDKATQQTAADRDKAVEPAAPKT
jgi:hypothetical protein